ncbi:DUF2975 domain-containing protein [Aeromonas veronii]|uniref:DUF2975 domain-containing protein n=1 Tax=Aeromonas veronii TaxID=654 RepID=UPI00193229D4|nr:DUF2975 domain-containing protein [Aeromonas veronii]MBM0418274.1 DUF2975 domain-containing protein [Aeromonas veronii]MBW3789385.1 DUF2975 domain-containing protein [Aeromonas veronii]
MISNKLERSSMLIEWLLLLALLATPLITLLEVWTPFGGADFLQEKLNTILSRPGINPADYPLHFSTRLLGTLVQLLPALVFMMMLWQLRQLFRGYRAGLLFTFEQIRRYRQIGLLLCTTFLVELILTPLLDTVLTMRGPEVLGTIALSTSDFRVLLAGLIVLALALVMREAKLLADEQQLTV